MVTIRDVAKKAGCSISTVSYALNGDRRISSETKERISQIAEELGYYPMNAARTLKGKKTFVIGIYSIGYLGPVLNELLDSVSIHMGKNDYNTIISTSLKTISSMVAERSIDGLIVIDAVLDAETMKRAEQRKLPICFLNQEISGSNIFTCVQDNKNSFYNITKMFISKGCSSIAYLSGTPVSFDNQQRRLGYEWACDEYNLEKNIIDGDFTIKSGYQAIKRMLEAGKRFDAIACANDEMCVGALEALREHNVFAPSDLLISGYDDIELSRYYSPHITTVSVDRYRWGILAAEKMRNILNDIKIDRSYTVNGTIVKRESTGF